MLMEEELSYVIRGCVYEVFKHLGCGFLEKVYENALLKELQTQGLHAESQALIKVSYKLKVCMLNPKYQSMCSIRTPLLVNMLLMLLSKTV